MKISIITPSLNSEKYILENLTSVHLQQQGKEFLIEQIIIDGGSSDKTIEIIESFKEKYNKDIKIIKGKDKNMYDAINKGLKVMTGDIWACLNTDDNYKKETISIVVENFITHPEIEVLYGNIEHVTENGEFICERYLPKFNLGEFISMGISSLLQQPAVFLRKSVIEKVGFFDIQYNYASDYDYLIRIGEKCKVMQIHKVLTRFRIHPNSISVNKKTNLTQNNESYAISNKYIAKLGIKKRNKFQVFLKFYMIQLKIKNAKYIKNKVKDIAFNNSVLIPK